MTKINDLTVYAEEVAYGMFVVFARDLNGVWFQHEGPVVVDYFTEAQAEALVRRVRSAGAINEQHWICGNRGRDAYGSFEHETALIELEREAA